MNHDALPKVTPEKIMPFLKKADADQTDVLYRLSHHVVRGCKPEAGTAGQAQILQIMQEGNDRQRMLIIQAAYHMVHRARIHDTFPILK